MSWDVFVYGDLRLPADQVKAWRARPLDGSLWTDWGDFGAAGVGRSGKDTVETWIGHAARQTKRSRDVGMTEIDVGADGTVRLRAHLDKSMSDFWQAFAVMFRMAGTLDGEGEWVWVADDTGPDLGYRIRVIDGGSMFERLTRAGMDRALANPAVEEIRRHLDKQLAATLGEPARRALAAWGIDTFPDPTATPAVAKAKPTRKAPAKPKRSAPKPARKAVAKRPAKPAKTKPAKVKAAAKNKK
jgi:hypothetical protein